MKLVYSAVLALMFSCVYSFVFFDDFLGEDIDYSKWFWTTDDFNFNTHYKYEVQDSWLSMNELWGKNKSLWNSIYLSSSGSFRLDTFELQAEVKWTEYATHWVTFAIGAGSGPQLSGIGISYLSGGGYAPQINIFFSNWGGENKSIPAPDPGIHLFKIGFDGVNLYAYVDNDLVHLTKPSYTQSASGINIMFGGPKEDEKDMYSPLHVDWVGVVPEPATLNLLFVGFFVLWKKYKKNH